MDVERYARQRILPQIGDAGQEALGSASVIIVGCGALGSHQAEWLARAGVGRLRIIDRDFVEPSNLQRQVLFTDADARRGEPKAAAAERALRAINPEISIEGIVDDLHPGSAEALLAGATVISDGTDNLETRYLINDFAVREGVPWVYGGVVGVEGIVLPVIPGETACLRCVFEEPPAPGALPTCETEGVLGTAAAVVAALQTTETIKIVVGMRDRVLGGIARFDTWDAAMTVVKVERSPTCPTCGRREFEFLEGRRGTYSTRLCGRNAIQLLPPPAATNPRLESIAERIGHEWDVVVNDHLLRATRNGITLHLFRDGRLIVDGIVDEREARSLYAKVVGT